MNNSINEISIKSKECKNSNHFSCRHQWEGFGFVINCNCECHDKKIVLRRDVLYHDRSNGNNVIAELNTLGEPNK